MGATPASRLDSYRELQLRPRLRTLSGALASIECPYEANASPVVLLMAVAGFTLAVSARGFLASTRLLWLSAGMSAAAIIAALASILWRARSRPAP